MDKSQHFRAVLFLKELPWRRSFKESCRDLIVGVKEDPCNSMRSHNELETLCYIDYKGEAVCTRICNFYGARDRAYKFEWMVNGEWRD